MNGNFIYIRYLKNKLVDIYENLINTLKWVRTLFLIQLPLANLLTRFVTHFV